METRAAVKLEISIRLKRQNGKAWIVGGGGGRGEGYTRTPPPGRTDENRRGQTTTELRSLKKLCGFPQT